MYQYLIYIEPNTDYTEQIIVHSVQRFVKKFLAIKMITNAFFTLPRKLDSAKKFIHAPTMICLDYSIFTVDWLSRSVDKQVANYSTNGTL